MQPGQSFRPSSAPILLSLFFQSSRVLLNLSSLCPCPQFCNTGEVDVEVTCRHLSTDELMQEADCTGDKPDSKGPCNTQPCAWVTGAWSSCSEACDSGTQNRTVHCQDSLGELVEDSVDCEEEERPANSQACNTHTCSPGGVSGAAESLGVPTWSFVAILVGTALVFVCGIFFCFTRCQCGGVDKSNHRAQHFRRSGEDVQLSARGGDGVRPVTSIRFMDP